MKLLLGADDYFWGCTDFPNCRGRSVVEVGYGDLALDEEVKQIWKE